jgi:PKD repeat protein
MQARTIGTRRVVARRFGRFGWLPVLAAVALTGCQVKKTEAPELTGPSELGLSLELRAVPDVVTMDGQSQSQITVVARDENGNPAGNRGVRVEITAGGQVVDIGRLSTKNVVTGSNGQATLTYTAPSGAPSQNADPGAVITIVGTPAGTDYRGAVARQVDIRLVPQGVVLPRPYSPVARFTVTPQPPDEGGDVTFDATTSIASCLPDATEPQDISKCTPQPGTITSYQWDFGNGQTGSGVRATTRYQTRGTYTAHLTVINDRGLSHTVSDTINVSSVARPSAAFSFSPTTPAINQAVFFDASASQASPGRTIASHRWTFGDGATGGGRQPSHRYSRVGTYSVTLTVVDSAGQTGTTTQQVTVGEGLQPTANFTVSPASVGVNQRVFFDGTLSEPTPGRTITRYVWNLGDNTIVEGPRTDHAYTRAGTYTVVLTVTDSSGATGTATKTVTVQ